jgi:hypothetical protein
VQGHAKLAQIIAAEHPTRGFASLLYRRQKQSNQDADNRHNDQQLNESEC